MLQFDDHRADPWSHLCIRAAAGHWTAADLRYQLEAQLVQDKFDVAKPLLGDISTGHEELSGGSLDGEVR